MDVEKLAAELGVEVGIVSKQVIGGDTVSYYEIAKGGETFRFETGLDMTEALRFAGFAMRNLAKPSGGLPSCAYEADGAQRDGAPDRAGVGHLPGWQNTTDTGIAEALRGRQKPVVVTVVPGPGTIIWQSDKDSRPAEASHATDLGGEALDSWADEGGAEAPVLEQVHVQPAAPAQPQAGPGTVSGASFADRQNNPTAAGNRRPADTTAKRRVQVARGGTVV